VEQIWWSLVQSELLRQQESLADADHVDGQHHVVAQLHRLAGARAAGVEDVFPHRRQDRLAAGEGVLGAANHEGQGGIRGADRSARDRGVEHGEARSRGRRGDGAGAVHVGGGAIDQQGLGVLGVLGILGVRDRLDQAALVQPGLAHFRAGGQHGDDEVGVLCSRRRAGCGGAAGGGQGLERGGTEVIAGDVVAGLDEVGSHGCAHVAEADETDGRHVVMPRRFRTPAGLARRQPVPMIRCGCLAVIVHRAVCTGFERLCGVAVG
jgi:hypothetical protein